jgi:hypothetical protein
MLSKVTDFGQYHLRSSKDETIQSPYLKLNFITFAQT